MGRQKAADEFELCTSELFQRLIEDDLGWQVTQNRIQSRGAQHGKDIQLTWIADGREYKWHIECKSHQHGSLRKEEVMPKLFDAWRSAHEIDVWCLALAHIEPGNAIDEFLAAIPSMLALPFRISKLSPAEHNLPMLLSCYPDLYERVYQGSMRITLKKSSRRRVIQQFRDYLIEASLRSIEPQESQWALVTPDAPERLAVQSDDDDAATEYLRGFTPSSWDAIAYEWAVPRPKAEEPILSLANSAKPGVTFGWRTGPAGEGKSTSARAAAWTLASTTKACVIWGEGEFEPLYLPIDWIDGLSPGAPIFVFVDGTRSLHGTSRLRSRHRSYQAEGRVVVLVLIDRGVASARSPIRLELSRNRGRFDQLGMPTLDDPEVSSLLKRLNDRNILRVPHAEAVTRLEGVAGRDARADGGSWLLPTMMEITDPDHRGFDEILGDLLAQVGDVDPTALALLLATALADAAGAGLPQRVAEDIVGGDDPQAYSEALALLRDELLRRPHAEPEDRVPTSRLLTYSALVARGFIRLTWGSTERRPSLEDTCHLMIASAGLNSQGGRIARREFDLLHRVALYLEDELGAFQLCVDWLDAWIRLEDPPINYLALHRLGGCLVAWMKVSLQAKEAGFAEELAEKARAVFVETLEIAEQVLGKGVERPPVFEHKNLDYELRSIYTSLAALEGFAGTHFANEQLLLQSAFLSILGLAPNDTRAVSNMALNMIEIGSYPEAAILTSAARELGTNRSISKRLQSELDSHGVEIPSGGLGKLGPLLGEVTKNVLLPELDDQNWPYSEAARKERLRRTIPAIRLLLPEAGALDWFVAACAEPADPSGL
jgi:hypothetical protein